MREPLIFQPIPKPAVNDLPLVPNRTKIETGAAFLFALLKKLDEEIEPSAKQVETVHPA